jgi:hypothetical protein
LVLSDQEPQLNAALRPAPTEELAIECRPSLAALSAQARPTSEATMNRSLKLTAPTERP